jgi:hypothetical protein
VERATDDVQALPLQEPDGRPRARRVAIGDPQAPFEKVLAVLDRRGLLGSDGRVVPDVQLVSMGDHFDWGPAEKREAAGRSASLMLAWLAAHAPDQVVLLAGNHDLGRVGELASFDDESWNRARVEADAIARLSETGSMTERAFLSRYPSLPSAEIASRDFSTFDVSQRDRVRDLLRVGRFRLAFAPSSDLLLTHAGITVDDLANACISVEPSDASSVCDALNGVFDRTVSAWLASHPPGAPLELPGLHRPGSAVSGEGRGVLYHRPANPEVEPSALFEGPHQRRFDPRRLPRGLVQAIGHIRDGKCRSLLGSWSDGEPARDGPLRHLRTNGSLVRYARGTAPSPGPDEAVMLFLDGGLYHADVDLYELLDLDSRQGFAPPL